MREHLAPRVRRLPVGRRLNGPPHRKGRTRPPSADRWAAPLSVSVRRGSSGAMCSRGRFPAYRLSRRMRIGRLPHRRAGHRSRTVAQGRPGRLSGGASSMPRPRRDRMPARRQSDRKPMHGMPRPTRKRMRSARCHRSPVLEPSSELPAMTRGTQASGRARLGGMPQASAHRNLGSTSSRARNSFLARSAVPRRHRCGRSIRGTRGIRAEASAVRPAGGTRGARSSRRAGLANARPSWQPLLPWPSCSSWCLRS